MVGHVQERVEHHPQGYDGWEGQEPPFAAAEDLHRAAPEDLMGQSWDSGVASITDNPELDKMIMGRVDEYIKMGAEPDDAFEAAYLEFSDLLRGPNVNAYDDLLTASGQQAQWDEMYEAMEAGAYDDLDAMLDQAMTDWEPPGLNDHIKDMVPDELIDWDEIDMWDYYTSDLPLPDPRKLFGVRRRMNRGEED